MTNMRGLYTDLVYPLSMPKDEVPQYTFKDYYDAECSLQDSSVAGPNCIWLGRDTDPLGNKRSLSRMHLTQDHVRNLMPYLVKFLQTGDLGLYPPVEAVECRACDEGIDLGDPKFDIVLDNKGPYVVKLLSLLRKNPTWLHSEDFSIKDLKDLLDLVPLPFGMRLLKEEAEAIKTQLEEAGAKVSLNPLSMVF